jgi:hypothetical protein
MLIRLVLVLLLMLGSMPAMATGCMDMPADPVMAMIHGDGMAQAAQAHGLADDRRSNTPAPAPAAGMDHACPGCIPPTSWDAPRLALPMLAPALARSIDPVAGLVLPAIPPALPPPRNG